MAPTLSSIGTIVCLLTAHSLEEKRSVGLNLTNDCPTVTIQLLGDAAQTLLARKPGLNDNPVRQGQMLKVGHLLIPFQIRPREGYTQCSKFNICCTYRPYLLCNLYFLPLRELSFTNNPRRPCAKTPLTLQMRQSKIA
jgi:hypothetical protein